MKARKLLYVADGALPSLTETERLLALQSLGLEETVCLLPGKVEGWEARLTDHGVKCKIFVRKDPSVTEILDTAREEAVSLIATNLTKGVGRMQHRSFTKALIRSTSVPLLLMPKSPEVTPSQEESIFARVLFATDWLSVSKKPLQSLLDLNEIIGELEIVTVISTKLQIRDMINLKKVLAETRKAFLDRDIDAEAHIYAGKPSEEIMLAAKDYDATSIVMGTKRTSKLRDIFIKNCSHAVSERALVPTLIIP